MNPLSYYQLFLDEWKWMFGEDTNQGKKFEINRMIKILYATVVILLLVPGCKMKESSSPDVATVEINDFVVFEYQELQDIYLRGDFEYNSFKDKIDEFVHLYPNYSLGWFLYSSLLASSSEIKDMYLSLAYADSAIYFDNMNCESYFNKGFVYDRLSIYDSSIINYKNALICDSTLVQAYSYLAAVLYKDSNFNEALTYAELAVSKWNNTKDKVVLCMIYNKLFELNKRDSIFNIIKIEGYQYLDDLEEKIYLDE